MGLGDRLDFCQTRQGILWRFRLTCDQFNEGAGTSPFGHYERRICLILTDQYLLLKGVGFALEVEEGDAIGVGQARTQRFPRFDRLHQQRLSLPKLLCLNPKFAQKRFGFAAVGLLPIGSAT